MTSFIQDVIADLKKKNVDTSNLTFVLPSKRAGVFLKQTLAESIEKTQFSPEIIAIEEFVELLSDLKYASNTDVLFEFYEVYINCTPKDQIEPFDAFSKWAQLLLQDFNEIDRYLIAKDRIFDYLKDIKEIDHWSLEDQKTEHIKQYLAFWKRLKIYYQQLTDTLITKKKGYQGLVYKEAVNNLEQYIASNQLKKHVFIGFNALNKAEETIIQELLQQELATIYWDIDDVFINNPIHDAGLFLRNHIKNWPYFKTNSFDWITQNYSTSKNIQVIGAPKNIGQVKYIGEILSNIQSKQRDLKKTAVILGDESLLLPLLNSIPEALKSINITMGMPLKAIPLASLFEELFKIHKTGSIQLFYTDVISILSHQFIKPLFLDDTKDYSELIISHIQNNNVVYLTLEKLSALAKPKKDLIEILFSSWGNSPSTALKQSTSLIMLLKEHFSKEKLKNLLSLEYLYRFNEIFNELQLLNTNYNHIYNINTLFGLYKELINSETLDFKGEPLKGLQIMGMLESRVVDFDTVIISSVNEGILPAGKSSNSFIPYDVKLENGLPTYKEKDAVYTYHFYRLLQRAKHIYILYNTEPDVLKGGEKSRFITQLEIEKIHSITHSIVTPAVPALAQQLKTVQKSENVINKLKEIAKAGFSPSSLTNYIRNPIDFYYEKILGISSYDEVEETVAANTLGNVIHQTLEDFYKPLKGLYLNEDHIKKMKSQIDKTVAGHFKSNYKEGDITKGKNLIIFEIAKRYVHNFLNKELEVIKAGNEIKIIDVELKLQVPLNIKSLDFPILLRGTVDRIDECNGVTRIIDYKTGKVEQNKVEIIEWSDLTTDYDLYSKSFQVLTYAYMLYLQEPFRNQVEGGIISFKNLQGDYFLKFAKKDKSGKGAIKENQITKELLDAFVIELENLIVEICNPDIDFIEKIV